MNIEELYKGYCEDYKKYRAEDIYEHLPTLKEYGSKVSTITEMGVRWGASTVALASSIPNKMRSYDIANTSELGVVINTIKELDIDFEFILADTLDITIEETDLLFIDTLHIYQQLITELRLHSDNVKEYIILHDTVSFASVDENIYKHASEKIKKLSDGGKRGLMTAVNDFLLENNKWELEMQYDNNNGLTVLRRKI